MKTFLIAVVVAAAAAFITYELTIKGPKGTSYSFGTPQCERVKLKIVTTEENAVHDFEQLLEKVAPFGKNGTVINIRYLVTSSGKWVEVQGPSPDKNDFPEVNPDPNCPAPAGSMHNTQKVNTSTQQDYKAVMDSFDFSTTSSPVTSPATPTPTP